jgi:hypothetical protein
MAQVRTAGQIVGVVQDPTGAVVPGAKVVAVDEATGYTKETTSGPDGGYVIPDLVFGTYRVTVTSQGFRTAVYPGVKVDTGRTANLTVKLELGTSAETITVEAGTDVLQTTTPAVESTVTGKQMRALPLNNRDVLDFVLLLPGGQQGGSARQATFNGLPKGALNITLDGLNVQDNINKSSFGGGMFTIIRPKLDNVEEITVTTAAAGADAAGEGSVTIRFVTRRGGNDYHGGTFYQYRHEGFNANSWVNNANGSILGPFASGQERNPRNKNRLTVYGFNLGGPIIKEKVFFFFSYEDFRLPGSQQRNNTVLTTDAQAGGFTYLTTAAITSALPAYSTCQTAIVPSAATPIPANTTCRADLFQLATAAGVPAAVNNLDPIVAGMLNVINPIVASGRGPGPDLIRDSFIYTAPASQRRWFPTMRTDWNITKKLRWSGIANYNEFISFPDTLNFEDASFPGTGFEGGQFGRRHSLTTSLNWEVKPNISYEFRWGRQSAITRFFPEHEPGTGGPGDLLTLFNHGGILYKSCWTLGLTSLDASPGFGGNGCAHSLPAPRDTPVMQSGNNVYWQKGKHGINFGTSLTVVTAWSNSFGNAGIPQVLYGASQSLDPLSSAINRTGSTPIPGISSTDPSGLVGNAQALYALLTGRLSSVTSSTNLNELSKEYNSLAPLTRRDRQNEFGVYITDQWRVLPSLTVTGGIRWEYQGIPYNRQGIYTGPSYEDIWGKSGVNNLFMPGTLTGNQNPVINIRSRDLADRYFKAWAPSLGMAWTPKNDSTWYKWMFGGSSKSVFRGGYSIAYTREGFTHFTNQAGNNPGLSQTNTALSGTDFCTGLTAAGAPGGTVADNNCLLARTGLPATRNDPLTFSFPVPVSRFTFSNSLNTYDPSIRPPYVQSWTASWQREITPSTVVDFRYVANHGTALWRRFTLNEVNILENGFLPEFINAQSNLAICRANAMACLAAAGETVTDPTLNARRFFSNLGLPGQVAVPIFSTAFTGSMTGSQTNSNFRGGSFIGDLDTGQAGVDANRLAGSSTFLCNMVGNGLQACIDRGFTGAGLFPSNFFQVNPDLAGVSNIILRNFGNSTYHALQIEVRRRFAKGFELNANYAFSKGITDRYDDSGTSTIQPTTFRDPGRNKGLSPFDITHIVRIFGRYEFPFGPGKKWNSSNGIVSRFIEGWTFQGVVAIQSGRPFLLTSGRGTLNQNESGVITNLTRGQLESLVGEINQVPGRNFVYFVDPSLMGASSSAPAGSFPIAPASANATANPAFLGPPTTPGVLGRRIFLHGPNFFKPDFSISKTTRITEQARVEFRAEFFNATNRTNWLVGGPGGIADTVSVTSTAFGRTTNFLNDLGNQDQGPRMIQFLLRFNF